MKEYSKFWNNLYIPISKNRKISLIVLILCFIFCIGCYSCIQTVKHLGANFSLLSYLNFFLIVALLGYFFTRFLKIDINLTVQILSIFAIYFTIVTVFFLYSHKDNFATIFRLPPGFESIDPGPVEGKQFFFDGHTDFWTFVLYRDGIMNNTIDKVGMEEKTAYLYSILYSLMGGDNQFYIISFLMFAKLFTVFIIVHFLKEYLNPKHLFCLVLMIFIMPDELVATHLGHKDVIVTFLIFIAFYLNFNALKEFRIIKLLILLLLLIIVMAFVRSSLVLVIEFLIFFTLFLWHKKRSKIMILFVLLHLCIFILFLFFSDFMSGHFERKILQKFFDKIVIGIGHGNPSYAKDYFIYRNSSITKKYFSNINIYNIYLLPLKSFAYFISPFPLHRFEFRWNWLISIGTLINIFSMPFFAVGIFYTFKNKNKIFLFSIIYFIFLSFSAAMAGPFIHERYRIMTLPLFYGISIYGSFLSTMKSRIYLFEVGGILLIFLYLVYYILKA